MTACGAQNYCRPSEGGDPITTDGYWSARCFHAWLTASASLATEGMGPRLGGDDVEEGLRTTSLLPSGKRHRCPQIYLREWENKLSPSDKGEGGGTPKGAPW